MRRSVLRCAGRVATVVLVLAALAQLAQAAGQALVGVYYAPWFQGEDGWASTWGTPILGRYNSADEAVIAQHHEWLRCAGVDFIAIDWSNNIDCAGDYTLSPLQSTCSNHHWGLEDATIKIFEVFGRLGGVKIAILIGSAANPGDYQGGGRMWTFGQKVFDMFAGNPANAATYFNYQGRPLLLSYLGTPVPYSAWGKVIPDWDDARFTVRHVSGFLSDQPHVLSGDTVTAPFWSWEDRNNNVWNLNSDGSPEATVVTAANRGDCQYGFGDPPGNPWGCPHGLATRNGGVTFQERWDRAIAAGVDVVMVQSWNEFIRDGGGEELDADRSNDIEPTVEHGMFYLQALANNIMRFKQSKGFASASCDLMDPRLG